MPKSARAKPEVKQQNDLLKENKKKMDMFLQQKQNLPKDFAGRIFKLEMQVEKGVGYATVDEVQSLMDLYT